MHPPHPRTVRPLARGFPRCGQAQAEMGEEEEADRDDHELCGVDGHRVGNAIGP